MRKSILWMSLAFSGVMTGAGLGMIATGSWLSPLAYSSAALLVVTTTGLCVLGAKKARSESNIRSETVLRDPDAFQASFHRGFRYFPWIVLLSGAANALQMSFIWQDPHNLFRVVSAGFTAAVVFSVSGLFSYMLSGRSQDPRVRRVLQDEFFQDNLAKARGNGFFAFLVAMPICFLVGLIEPLMTVSLLPVATGVCVAVAGWQFNRRGERAMAPDESPER